MFQSIKYLEVEKKEEETVSRDKKGITDDPHFLTALFSDHLSFNSAVLSHVITITISTCCPIGFHFSPLQKRQNKEKELQKSKNAHNGKYTPKE